MSHWSDGLVRPHWESEVRFNTIDRLLATIDFKGKRVIDVACGTGVYSCCALLDGATHSTLFEDKQHHLNIAERNLKRIEMPEDKYKLVYGDVFKMGFPKADVALLTGFLYHTHRQHEIVSQLVATGASIILIETMVDPGDYMAVRHEIRKDVYIPTRPMCRAIIRECGYNNWQEVETMAGRMAFFLRKESDAQG